MTRDARMDLSSSRRCAASGRRGFTLVEMLVAVGIIAILVALTVTVSTALARRGEVTRTETTIRLLDTALSEWETRSERTLSWGPFMANGDVHDMYAGEPHALTVTEILRVIMRAPPVRELVARIDPEFLTELDPAQPPVWVTAVSPDDPDPAAGQLATLFASGLPNPDGTVRTMNGQRAVLDAWGTPIRAVHPGGTWFASDGANGSLRDEDGTVRTVPEFLYGIARSRRVVFVSAGPDRRFGRLDGTDEDRRQAEDNILSYEVMKP